MTGTPRVRPGRFLFCRLNFPAEACIITAKAFIPDKSCEVIR